MVRLMPCLFVVWLAGNWAFAHKYHASLAELEYSEQAGQFQLALRLFADDLEWAISKDLTDKIRLEDPTAPTRILRYIQQRVQLHHQGKTLSWHWLGMEAEVDVVWIYLEAPFAGDPTTVRLSNGVFMDLFTDQVNTVIVRRADRSRFTLVFQKQQSEPRRLVPGDIPSAMSTEPDQP